MTAGGSADEPSGGAAALVARLRDRGVTIATAESLTAGMLASTLAGVPGASAVLRGGLVVYATDLKHRLAGVPEDLLAEYGAVSAPTARALAEGAAHRCAADVGVGLTGVAGPDRQEGHPAGTVFVGLRLPGRSTVVLEPGVRGDRAAIRRGACDAAIDGLLDALA